MGEQGSEAAFESSERETEAKRMQMDQLVISGTAEYRQRLQDALDNPDSPDLPDKDLELDILANFDSQAGDASSQVAIEARARLQAAMVEVERTIQQTPEEK